MKAHRCLSLAASAVLATAAIAQGTQADAAGLKSSAVFPKDAKPELLWEGGTWLEGPAVTPTGEVYFSDIISGGVPRQLGVIRVFDPRSKQTRLFQSPSNGSNGLLFDAEGRLLAAHGADFGGRYITRTDMNSRMSEVIAAFYEGRAFNSPNDLALDRKGRIYFSDPRYYGHEPLEQPVMGVYRVDPDLSVHLIIRDLARPNGLAISADGRRLYVVEADVEFQRHASDAPGPQSTGKLRVHGYDLAEDGTVSNDRVLIDYSGRKMAVDGIKTGRDGNLYVTELSQSPGIRVLSPSGKALAFLATPEQPINLTFAKADGIEWLYFTTAKRLYRIRLSAG